MMRYLRPLLAAPLLVLGLTLTSAPAGADSVLGVSISIPGGNAGPIVTSCVSAKNCVAAGITSTAKVWFVTQTNGRLGAVTLRTLPSGTTEIYSGVRPSDTGPESLSCSSLTHCVALFSNDVHTVLKNSQLLYFSMTNGTWGNFQTVTGFPQASAQGARPIGSVICTTATSCTIYGDFHIAPYDSWTVFAATVNAATVGTPFLFPASAYDGDDEYYGAIGCVTSANWCVVSGQVDGLTSGTGRYAFVGTLTAGVPSNLSTLAAPTGFDGHSQMLKPTSITCTSVNNCTMTGLWTNDSGVSLHQFRATLTNGKWSVPVRTS